MSEASPIVSFGSVARDLARNTLGIIALFIVLVYGFATLVTGFASSLTPDERAPLIWFLALFPVLVFCVFAWLVSQHSDKLFAPSDFKNEENFLHLKNAAQIKAAVALTAASSKSPGGTSGIELDKIVESIQSTATASNNHTTKTSGENWSSHVLWVDDRPENNEYERRALEAMGIRFTLALNTSDALERLKKVRFAAIISDMGRREGPREGYVLLDTIRKSEIKTPLYFYSASRSPEHIAETLEHGGQGCTNNPHELFELVTKAVINPSSPPVQQV